MPKFSQPLIAPAFIGGIVPVNPFAVVFYVSNTTNPGEDQGAPDVTAQGRSPKTPFMTIAAAVTAAVSGRGDVVVIQRGGYTEDITIDKAALTLVGAPMGGFQDHVVITGRVTITANGVSMYGIEVFANAAIDTTNPANRDQGSCVLGSWANEPNSLWFERCSFSSNGTTEPGYGVRLYGGTNLVFRDCVFTDVGYGINLNGGTTSFPANVEIANCLFRENTTADVRIVDVRNLAIYDNVFAGGATNPTHFINISGGSGLVARNVFAQATNAIGTLVIPAGVLWGPNGSEAGWSAARPA